MSEILSAKGDIKEERIIERMKNNGYTLIGELSADGVHDDYVKKYIRYTGTEEGLRSRARNQKAIIQKIDIRRNIIDEILGMKNGEEPQYAENEEELKNGGILKNDGTAFIFVKTSEFNEVMKKMKDDSRIGDVIPGTDDIITEVGNRVVYQGKEALEVNVNYSSRWMYIDIETGERILPSGCTDIMTAILDDAAQGGVASAIDEILSGMAK